MKRRTMLLSGGGIAAAAFALTRSTAATHPSPDDTDSRDTNSKDTNSRIPNTLLRTHKDRPVRFYDDLVKGRNVLITFMYTSCDGI